MRRWRQAVRWRPTPVGILARAAAPASRAGCGHMLEDDPNFTRHRLLSTAAGGGDDASLMTVPGGWRRRRGCHHGAQSDPARSRGPDGCPATVDGGAGAEAFARNAVFNRAAEYHYAAPAPALGAPVRPGRNSGAVAVDANRHVRQRRRPRPARQFSGRIGDSAVIGAGTYADDSAGPRRQRDGERSSFRLAKAVSTGCGRPPPGAGAEANLGRWPGAPAHAASSRRSLRPLGSAHRAEHMPLAART